MNPDKILAQEFLRFVESEKKARMIAGITLGDGIGPGAATGAATGAVGGAAGGPIGIAGGAILGFLSNIFGGDSELGPATPGVFNPETGNQVHCGKPDETARVQQMANGDYAWLFARLDGRNYYDHPEVIPFPQGKSQDEIAANIMAALAMPGRPGQCPDMTRVAGEQLARLKLKIARSSAQPSMFSSTPAYNEFVRLMGGADARLQDRTAIGQAGTMGQNLYGLQQGINTLSPQDQALMNSLMQSRGITSNGAGLLGQVADGDTSSYTQAQMQKLNMDVAHLTSIMEGLRNPNPINKQDAKDSLDALSGGIMPLVIVGSLGLFGLIAIALASKK